MELFNFDESFISQAPTTGIDMGVPTSMRMCNIVVTPNGTRRATNAEFQACYAELEQTSPEYNVKLQQNK